MEGKIRTAVSLCQGDKLDKLLFYSNYTNHYESILRVFSLENTLSGEIQKGYHSTSVKRESIIISII